MAEYIEREAAKRYLAFGNACSDGVLDLLDEVPAADVAPVVHGRWETGYPITCSVCGGYAATEYEDANIYEAWLSPYCPNCGAKMVGERKGDE